MHTGSRAFYFLMALAATGAECASAAVPVSPVDPGHYRVEAKLVDGPRASTDKADETLPAVVVANHVLAVIAVSHSISLPSGNPGLSDIELQIRPDSKGGFKVFFARSIMYPAKSSHSDNTSALPGVNRQQFRASIGQTADGYHVFSLPSYGKWSTTYDADGRRLASIADANERQLLFVKITRG